MNRPLQEPKDRIWQQRKGRTPSDHENSLSEALDSIFEQGTEDLDSIVERLNELSVASPDGAAWTTKSFQDEIAKLGTKEF